MYQAITRNIQVTVNCAYMPERSDPARPYHFFAYTITIKNLGERGAKLQRRHWIITDGARKVAHVEGEGVVGQQPLIKPGEAFEYTSFCPLQTPTGNMRGTYFMVDEAGAVFDVEIPLFFLRI